MANGWTLERRERQAELIKDWRPWEHSTGPRSEAGRAITSRNAWKGNRRGVLRELGRALQEQRQSLGQL